MCAANGSALPRPNSYTIRAVDNRAEKDWTRMCAMLSGPLEVAWDQLTVHPLETGSDQYQLKGELSTVTVGGVTLPQWQYKPTRSARIWYAVDEESKTVWLTRATMSHPKETERGHRGSRK